MPTRKNISNRLLLTEARDAELRGNTSKALALYKQAVQHDPLAEQAWQRLMILHRKQRDYAGELKIIDLALKAYETSNRQAQQQWLKENRKAAGIAKLLAKSLGQVDKKGMVIDDNPVVEKWRHRKELVAGRLKKLRKVK